MSEDRTQQPGDIMLGGIPFMLAKTEGQLKAVGASRAWQVDYLESSPRRLTGVDRNTSQTKDTLEFTYRWDLAHMGYGDGEDIRQGRYWYGYGDGATPMAFECPPKITTITLTGATANCSSIIRVTDNSNSRIYAAAGRYIYIINPTDDTFTTLDCGANQVAQDLVVFDDYLYIAMTTSNFRRFGPLSTGGSLAAAHGSLKFIWFHVANETLWGVVPLSGATRGGLRKCASGADPTTAGNWSPASPGELVGFSQTDIQKPMNLGKDIFMGKPEGFFSFDLNGEVQGLIPDLEGYQDVLNFHHGGPYRGRLMLPHETGLYMYHPATLRIMPVGPETHELNTSAIKGYIRASCQVGRFLFIAMEDTSGNTYILKGHPMPISEKEPFAWWPLTKVSENVCRAMYYSDLTDPRLWFGNDYNISYYRLGGTRTYESGDIYFPYYDDGYPFDDKVFTKAYVEGTLSATETITLKYTLDGGTERTVGSAFTSETSQAISTNNTGKRISVHAVMGAKSDGTVTSKLRAIVFQGIRRPAMRAVVTAHILCADNQKDRNGKEMKLTAAEQLAQLRTYSTSTSTVAVYTPEGTSRTMYVLPEIKEQEVTIEGQRHPGIVATVMLRAS